MKLLQRRRRMEGRTNYTKRRRLLEGKKPRIVIRKTNRYIIIQYIESRLAQDKVKVTIDSKELLNYSWPKNNEGSLKSLGAAYLTGLLFAKKIVGEKKAILDTGLLISTRGSRIYADVKGINDGGFELNCNPEVYPVENRIKNDKNSAFFDKVKSKIEGEK